MRQRQRRVLSSAAEPFFSVGLLFCWKERCIVSFFCGDGDTKQLCFCLCCWYGGGCASGINDDDTLSVLLVTSRLLIAMVGIAEPFTFLLLLWQRRHWWQLRRRRRRHRRCRSHEPRQRRCLSLSAGESFTVGGGGNEIITDDDKCPDSVSWQPSSSCHFVLLFLIFNTTTMQTYLSPLYFLEL